jgi:hypothetical protein
MLLTGSARQTWEFGSFGNSLQYSICYLYMEVGLPQTSSSLSGEKKTHCHSTLTFLAAFAVILPTADTSTRVVFGVSGVVSIGLISWCFLAIRPKPARDYMEVVSIFDGGGTALWTTLQALCATFRIRRVRDLEEGGEEKTDGA